MNIGKLLNQKGREANWIRIKNVNSQAKIQILVAQKGNFNISNREGDSVETCFLLCFHNLGDFFLDFEDYI